MTRPYRYTPENDRDAALALDMAQANVRFLTDNITTVHQFGDVYNLERLRNTLTFIANICGDSDASAPFPCITDSINGHLTADEVWLGAAEELSEYLYPCVERIEDKSGHWSVVNSFRATIKQMQSVSGRLEKAAERAAARNAQRKEERAFS